MIDPSLPPNPFAFGKLIVDPGALSAYIAYLQVEKEKALDPHPETQALLCNAVIMLNLILEGFPEEKIVPHEKLQEALRSVIRIEWSWDLKSKNKRDLEDFRDLQICTDEVDKLISEINELFSYPGK